MTDATVCRGPRLRRGAGSDPLNARSCACSPKPPASCLEASVAARQLRMTDLAGVLEPLNRRSSFAGRAGYRFRRCGRGSSPLALSSRRCPPAIRGRLAGRGSDSPAPHDRSPSVRRSRTTAARRWRSAGASTASPGVRRRSHMAQRLGQEVRDNIDYRGTSMRQPRRHYPAYVLAPVRNRRTEGVTRAGRRRSVVVGAFVASVRIGRWPLAVRPSETRKVGACNPSVADAAFSWTPAALGTLGGHPGARLQRRWPPPLTRPPGDPLSLRHLSRNERREGRARRSGMSHRRIESPGQ